MLYIAMATHSFRQNQNLEITDVTLTSFCNQSQQNFVFLFVILMYQSIPSLTIPRVTPVDSHILLAPGVGFSLLCLARGGGGGGEVR